MNRVPVARLGPIFSQDGATLTRKLFKCLPGPFPPVWGPKISGAVPKGSIGNISAARAVYREFLIYVFVFVSGFLGLGGI